MQREGQRAWATPFGRLCRCAVGADGDGRVLRADLASFSQPAELLQRGRHTTLAAGNPPDGDVRYDPALLRFPGVRESFCSRGAKA